MGVKSFGRGIAGGMTLGILGAGAILFMAPGEKDSSGLEDMVNHPNVVEKRLAEEGIEYKTNTEDNVKNVAENYTEEKVQENVNGTVENPYAFLDAYDEIVNKNVDGFNRMHGVGLDSDLIKAMIAVESGSKRFRDESKADNAFEYDPMQIANDGDYALDVLSSGGEDSEMLGDFNGLKGKRKTSWNKKKKSWDYSNSNMTPEDSIHGGIGWLLNKSVENVETEDIVEYVVQDGDNLWKIAKENGSTFETLKKYNEGINLDRLKVGQKINFKSAYRGFNPNGVNWEESLGDYNGGGNPNYVEEVMEVYNDLKELKTGGH